MGLRGPKPKGVKSDQDKGFDKKYESDIKPLPEEPPEALRDGAKMIWRDMHRKGSTSHLTSADAQAFCRYCDLAARICELEEMAETESPIIQKLDKSGENIPIRNPAHGLLNDNIKIFLSYSKSLGLTPDGRKGYQLPGSSGDNLRDSPNNFDEHETNKSSH